MVYRSAFSRVRLGTALTVAGAAAALVAGAAPAASAASAPRAQNAAPSSSSGAGAAVPSAPHGIAPDDTTPAGACSGGAGHQLQIGDTFTAQSAGAIWTASTPGDLSFAYQGIPQISLKMQLSGDTSCQTVLPSSRIKLDATGLTAVLTPKLDISSTGTVGTDFVWKPGLMAGFTVKQGKFTAEQQSFTNGPNFTFTAQGPATTPPDLHGVIENSSGKAGMTGDLGPTISATVTGPTTTTSSCWKAPVTASAVFATEPGALGFTAQAKQQWSLGGDHDVTGCVDKTVTFNGTPGTSAPPKTLGGYTMKPFAADTSALYTAKSSLTTPLGPAPVRPTLEHRTVPAGWYTWSHGYHGDAYATFYVQRNHNVQVIVDLPPGTGAFYAYAEPDNSVSPYTLTATADNGVSSGNVAVSGNGGARYFGFAATCGHAVKSVTFIDSGGDAGLAIGEMGIAPEEKACP